MSGASSRIADQLGLTEDERDEMLPSGAQRLLHNRIHWAKFYMSKAGLIESPKRGVFVATQTGRSLLATKPDRIDVELLYAYNGSLGERLKQAMRLVQEDLPEIIESNFNAQIEDVRHQTYLLSISEHGDTTKGDALEDMYGRLSMWRAYSRRNGVAFVFKNQPFVTETNALNAFTSPVLYATPDTFLAYFEKFVVSIETNIECVKSFGGALFHNAIMNAFRFTVQSTKHPSFHEEKEWRVIYSPTLLARDGVLTPQQIERVPTEIMDLGGTPQRIYAIPFKNYPEDDFVGATIPELIDRILIGPSPDAHAIADAFASELTTKLIENARERVWITGIPLRT
jgi:hypothetical protein